MQGAQGYWVSMLGLEPPEILGEGLEKDLQKEEHWEGLGSCLKDNPSHFVLVFNP